MRDSAPSLIELKLKSIEEGIALAADVTTLALSIKSIEPVPEVSTSAIAAALT